MVSAVLSLAVTLSLSSLKQTLRKDNLTTVSLYAQLTSLSPKFPVVAKSKKQFSIISPASWQQLTLTLLILVSLKARFSLGFPLFLDTPLISLLDPLPPCPF